MGILTFKVSKRFFLKGLFKITRKYKQFEQATELVFISLSATRNNEYNKNYIEQLYFNTREFDFKMSRNFEIKIFIRSLTESETVSEYFVPHVSKLDVPVMDQNVDPSTDAFINSVKRRMNLTFSSGNSPLILHLSTE